jgi:hypothetical protein
MTGARVVPGSEVDTRPRDTTDVDNLRDLQQALARVAAGNSEAQALHAFVAEATDYMTRNEHRELVAIGMRVALRKGWITGERRP